MANDINKALEKAREIVALIEPLDDLEQMAALDLASTLRGFNRAARARQESQLAGMEAQNSSALLDAPN
jgi:hypothetical protein